MEGKEHTFCLWDNWKVIKEDSGDYSLVLGQWPKKIPIDNNSPIRPEPEEQILTLFSLMRYETEYTKRGMTAYCLIMRRNPDRSVLKLMTKACKVQRAGLLN